MANWDKERLTDVMVTFCVAGSTKEISRTKASSEPPKNCVIKIGGLVRVVKIMIDGQVGGWMSGCRRET